MYAELGSLEKGLYNVVEGKVFSTVGKGRNSCKSLEADDRNSREGSESESDARGSSI